MSAMRQAAGIGRQKAFGALDGSVLRDVSFDATAIIRAGGSTPIATSHARQGTEEMDFDPVRMDDGRTVVCRTTDRGGKGTGFAGSLGDRGCARTCWWYVWAAYTPLVIGLAKRFPLTGPRLARHIALHTIVSLMMAPLASVTQYFLSLGLLRFVFHITGPDVHRFLSSFGVGVLFMSFTGILTYWLVVGLYQSMHFYQVAMERQTIAAQLETQLSHAELENLKSQLHPHFLFNSLHAIGVLMQEDVDAAGRLLVSLGDLLRMALERRENEITLQSELEFVGKYLEIEQTRFHDRLKVHMDIPPDLLGVYVPSLALQPLVENAIKHGFSVDSTASRLEIAAKLHNGRVWLCVRDDGPGSGTGVAPAIRRRTHQCPVTLETALRGRVVAGTYRGRRSRL